MCVYLYLLTAYIYVSDINNRIYSNFSSSIGSKIKNELQVMTDSLCLGLMRMFYVRL